MRAATLIGSVFAIASLVACGASEGDGDVADSELRGNRACGTRGGVQCSSSQYCDLGSSCGATDRGGACKAKPAGCTREFRPVCGCDGQTYSNRCVAAAAGVSVQADGACATDGGSTDPGDRLCGTRGGAACESSEYCDLGSSCGVTDLGGVCKMKPTVCMAVYMPVCGCDGQTYSNSCSAAEAGVSVRADGACAQSSEPPSP